MHTMNKALDVRLVPAAVVAWATVGLTRTWSGHALWGLLLAAVAVLTLLLLSLTPAHGSSWAPPGRGQIAAVSLVVMVCAALGLWRLDQQHAELFRQAADSGEIVEIEGVSTTEAKEYQPQWSTSPSQMWWVDVAVSRITLKGQSSAVNTTVRIFAQGEKVTWRSSIATRGKLSNDDSGGWTLRTRTVTVRAPPPKWLQWSNAVRAATMNVTDSLSAQGRGLVPGVAIGDTSRLPEDLSVAMKAAGMTHMTAVSGSHFAILTAAVWSALGLLRLPSRGRALMIVFALAILVIMVRPEPSVVRAAAMASLGVLATLLGRRSSALPALAATVLILIIVQPGLATELGFALSVAATAGLILLLPTFEARLGWLPTWVRTPLAVALAAQLLCAPIIVLVDPHVSLWSLVANTVAAPAMAPATVLGVLTALIAVPLPDLAHALAVVASWTTWWIATVAEFVTHLPGSRLGWWSGWWGLTSLAVLSSALAALIHYGPHLRWWWHTSVIPTWRATWWWHRASSRGRVDP